MILIIAIILGVITRVVLALLLIALILHGTVRSVGKMHARGWPLVLVVVGASVVGLALLMGGCLYYGVYLLGVGILRGARRLRSGGARRIPPGPS